MDDGRQAVLQRFRWVHGHGDIWGVLADAESLRSVVDELVAPWRHHDVTHVAGIESRGFLLGGAAAVALGVGFVAIRKERGLLPGPKVHVEAGADYRGERHNLRMQRHVGRGDRILLIDDWAERGQQAAAARQLVEACGATYVGLSIIVHELSAQAEADLGKVTSLLRAAELRR